MKTERIIALIFAFAVGYVMYLIMRPFLIAVFWGIILVILFHPYYKKLLKKTNNRTVSSLLACFTVALFLMIPLAVVGLALTTEISGLYGRAEEYINGIQVRAHNTPIFIVPYIQKFVSRYVDTSAFDIHRLVAEAMKESGGYLSFGIKSAIKSFAEFFFNLAVSFITMFFLFLDGGKLLNIVRDIIPLSDIHKERLLNRTRTVLTATFYGGVLIGALQGILGGLSFWVAGLNSPMLWGFAMFLLSFLPGIGTTLVWLPASIYLAVTGKTSTGLYLAAFNGIVLLGFVDHVLRQLLISGRTNLHPLLLFFSVLGAVNVFGLAGVIAGPVILCIAITAIEIYRAAASLRGSINKDE
ncbi:AI-2E family transporter [bacterium]|nr:MAG: AI-2E family transporter [bacterium]